MYKYFLILLLCLSAQATEFTVKRLELKGTPQEIGQQWGEAQKKEIVQLQALFKTMAMHYLKKSAQELEADALKISQYLSVDDVAEIKATAQICGIRYEDMLIYNLFYTLSVTKIACRQFSSWGDRTVDGKLLHARNLDWLDYPGQPMKKYNTIVNFTAKNQFELLMLTWPGFSSALTGTNEHGLTIGYNQLYLAGDKKHFSEPTFFTIKRALRSCKTLEEAVDLFKKTLPMDSGSVLISDATQKRVAVVEIIRGKVGVRYPAKDQLTLSNANHATVEAGIAPQKQTSAAGEPVCVAARQISEKLSATSVQKLMAHNDVMQAELNLLCVVFIPADNKMWLSCGRTSAAKGPFVEYELFKIKK